MFVTWYKDGKQLYASYKHNTKVTRNSCILEALHPCDKDTSGRYSCEVSNSHGTDICHAQVIAVTGAFAQEVSSSVWIYISQMFTVHYIQIRSISVRGLQYQIYKSESECCKDLYYFSYHIFTDSNLKRYLTVCITHSNIALSALEPARFVKKLQNVAVPMSQKLRLECTFTGAPKMFVTWYKDGKQLYASYRHNTKIVGNACILEALHACKSETSGIYSCEVSNSYGTDICHAEVNTAPGQCHGRLFCV